MGALEILFIIIIIIISADQKTIESSDSQSQMS